jgi:DNA-binding response OmpR family regulator
MSESERPSRGAAILIIEDDDVAATNLHNGLIGAGYVVRRVASGNEALVALKSTQADLILMSLMLPDTDGLILCSTVKAHFPAPIIVLSARGGEVDRALAIESGAIDCLTKPVDRDEFLAQVKAVVRSPVSAQARLGGRGPRPAPGAVRPLTLPV